MIKGISKQIIEIKCINDEYFEKILLFVKGERFDLSPSELNSLAAQRCSKIRSDTDRHGKAGISAAWTISCAGIAGLILGITAAAILL